MRSRFTTLLLLVSFVAAVYAERVPGRYIVELNAESVAELVTRTAPPAARAGRVRRDSQAGIAQRSKIRGEQQAARTRLAGRNAKVLNSVDTVANALFIEVSSEEEARAIAALPGVKRVSPVRTFHLVLDRAAQIHKAAEAWSRLGSDQAGLGVKVAIIDTGIESTHDGLQDTSLAGVEGFPRSGTASDLAFTNNKILVARSYVSMLPYRDPDYSARDHVGHGTALSMIVAGVRTAAPLATLQGIAPKAYLGNYKVFGTPGYNDGTTEDAVIKAIDDAVADGMDVINLSLGSDFAPRLEHDPSVDAVERAVQAGVIVVVAAGNSGPDLSTVGSPASAPSAIAVAASTNDRTFAAKVEVGSDAYVATSASNSLQATSVTATFVDVETLDQNGLACASLPSGSLSGRVALILRGTCNFEVKFNVAQAAGALGAIVYAAENSPSAISMYAGAATLPAVMVNFEDGTSVKKALAADPSLVGTLNFTLGAVPVKANVITDFSSAGPNVDNGIKPDITAVGQDYYTATQTYDQNGDMYSADGYILVNGTSFSSPTVAGAAALLKSARPGLTVAQYRSLLINTAAAMENQQLQRAGSGLLDVDAALTSTIAAYPASLSFGAGAGDLSASRTLSLTNFSGSTDTFLIESAVLKGDSAPAAQTNTVEVGAGGSVELPVEWTGSSLAVGEYAGFLTVSSSSTGQKIRIPYWYAVKSGQPAGIQTYSSTSLGRRNANLSDAFMFRAVEATGVTMGDVAPEVTVLEGGGSVRTVTSYDEEIPGLYGVSVRLGPRAGTNVFQVKVGDYTTTFTILGR